MTTGQYIGIGCGIIAVALFIIWVMSVVYRNRKDQTVQDWLYSALFAIDAECDAMETPQKKREAVAQIMELIGWRKIIVPAALVSWCLSLLVWLVRRTNVPDLHHEDQLKPPNGGDKS